MKRMQTESQKFQQLTEEFLAFLGRAIPYWATEAGDRRFDHLLGDFSADGIAQALRAAGEFSRRLRTEIDPAKLSAEEQLDWEILIGKLETHRPFLEETRPWERDPTLYVTLLTDSIYSLMVATLDSPAERLEKGTARLRQIAPALAAAQRNLINPPREFVVTAIEMAEGSLDYFQKLLRRFPQLKKEVLEAWHGYLRFLRQDLLPRSGGSPRLGKEKYDFLLRRAHHLEWGSDELLAMGTEAFRKIQEEIAAHAARIEKGRSWLEILRRAREPRPTRRGMLNFYRRLMREAREFISQRGLVEVPPEHKLAIDETPLYERPIIAHACYIPIAVLNPASQGLFFVTPVERSPFFWRMRAALKEHTFSEALLTVLHESFPGHHLQFLHAARHPSKLRRLFYDEFYSEGWAFYVEQMMLEQGFHATPQTWLFQKRNELWRALRIIIDVRLHTDESFSADEAADLMMRHLGYDALYARREVHRYLLEPTQAASYHVGKQQLLELKSDWARRQGAAFRLASFHNALLSTGSLPFKFVRRLLL